MIDNKSLHRPLLRPLGIDTYIETVGSVFGFLQLSYITAAHILPA
jgi:hypothetical protein